jgi:hypothetical protein
MTTHDIRSTSSIQRIRLQPLRATHRAPRELCADFVENRVHLGMHHVGVLGVQLIVRRARPGQLVVRAAGGEPVVADANDAPPGVHNAGAHLGGGVLRPHAGWCKQHNTKQTV